MDAKGDRRPLLKSTRGATRRSGWARSPKSAASTGTNTVGWSGDWGSRGRKNSADPEVSAEEHEVLDMSFPVVDTPPLVMLERLDAWQQLLLRYRCLDRKLDVAAFVDNRFVEAA